MALVALTTGVSTVVFILKKIIQPIKKFINFLQFLVSMAVFFTPPTPKNLSHAHQK